MHSRATMRKADVPRTCEVCGASFLAWLARTRGCSKRCRLRIWRSRQPSKARRPSIIPAEVAPRRPGLKTDPKAVYARAQVRDHRQRNRELVLERERRYRESLSPALRQHRARDYNLKMQYGKGFGIEQYEAMLVAQLGGCAICGRSPESGKPLHVVHDHKTGRGSGLLDRK